MQRLKQILLITVALFFISATVIVVAVEQQRQPQVLSVRDDRQQELHFFDLPQRIVILDEGVGLLIQQWQREELVIATTGDLASAFPRAENLGESEQLTALQIAATRPDLIIADLTHSTLVHELNESGIPALQVAPARLQRLLQWPESLGALLAAEQQATLTTRLLEMQLTEFQDQALLQASAGRRVLWFVNEEFTAAGRDTFEADLLELIGVRNVSATRNGYVVLEPEEILSLAPEVIVAPAGLQAQLQSIPELQLEAVDAPQLVLLTPDFRQIRWHDILARGEYLLSLLQPPPLLPEE